MQSSSSQQNVTADDAIIVSAERYTVKKATAIIVSADGTKMMLNRSKIIEEQERFYHRGKTYVLKSAIARSRIRSKSAPPNA
jgi:pectin methylesterase-like acyl-CoA thioesterase